MAKNWKKYIAKEWLWFLAFGVCSAIGVGLIFGFLEWYFVVSGKPNRVYEIFCAGVVLGFSFYPISILFRFTRWAIKTSRNE
jgi:hypothetical protein